MDGFTKLPKMQHFKEGGSVQKQIANYEKRERKVEEKADLDQDKKVVKKAIKMHDVQEHGGEKTDLSKLKKGGRAKKECGTVRKYKTGGTVENAYGAKKTDKDIKDIANSKRQKAKLLCGGGKAYAEGGLVDAVKAGATKLKENILGTEEQNKIGQATLDKQAAEGSKLAKILGGQGAVTDKERGTFNKKRGGKVC